MKMVPTSTYQRTGFEASHNLEEGATYYIPSIRKPKRFEFHASYLQATVFALVTFTLPLEELLKAKSKFGKELLGT